MQGGSLEVLQSTEHALIPDKMQHQHSQRKPYFTVMITTVPEIKKHTKHLIC